MPCCGDGTAVLARRWAFGVTSRLGASAQVLPHLPCELTPSLKALPFMSHVHWEELPQWLLCVTSAEWSLCVAVTSLLQVCSRPWRRGSQERKPWTARGPRHMADTQEMGLPKGRSEGRREENRFLMIPGRIWAERSWDIGGKTRANSVMEGRGTENFKRERLVISSNCHHEPTR